MLASGRPRNRTKYAFDGRGNLTSDGSRSFSYDLENHLLTVSGSSSLNLSYDPLGRLQTTSSAGNTTRYLYDRDRLVGEYNGSTLLRRYAHGAGADEPLVWYEGSGLSDRRWLHGDHQGSVVATSDGTGEGTLYAYGAYGDPAYDNWVGSRFRYTGQIMLPEAKLYHYKARVYDPILGRFLQTDPVGYSDDLDLYAYVGNDPLDKTDPTGLATYDFYPDGTIVVTQEFNNHSRFSDSQITAQAAKYNGPTSDGHKLQVVFTPGNGKDAVTIKANGKLNDTSPTGPRSHTDQINGRNIEIAPNAVGAITAGHEMGHILGAGDQYKGGLNANGNTTDQDSPSPSSPGSIMRDYGGNPANTQTRDEIQRNSSQPNNTVRTCSTSGDSRSCH